MGGIGSGRRWHWDAKSTTDDYRRLDVRRWARDGLLEPGNVFGWQWSQHGERVADIQVTIEDFGARLKYRAKDSGGDWKPMEYSVCFVSQRCHFGGHRKWFVCPARGCGRRVAILYGGKVFACRHCYQLAYPSQREERFQRVARRSDRIKRRLGWDDDARHGLKPKGMHWATFALLTEELDYWDRVWNSEFVTRAAAITNHKF